jgi:hypothetical protein
MTAMSAERNIRSENRASRLAHVIGRIGLSMSGAVCGTFVAAYLARVDINMFGYDGFVASMIVVGMAGFYLGIDVPEKDARRARVAAPDFGFRVDPVELLSATGTFLAAIAALFSVYAIVFDDLSRGVWEFVVGSWWLFGVVMQIGAGATARMRVAGKAIG